jgi:hypothetical protein
VAVAALGAAPVLNATGVLSMPRKAMFPGMITSSGDLMVLAIQQRGENLRSGETRLAVGETLLLQRSWAAPSSGHSETMRHACDNNKTCLGAGR